MTAIDWPGIRAASVAIGVRAAARQAGKDLPPGEQVRFVERVMKRCSREGWVTATINAKAAADPQGKPMSASVRTGAETLRDVLAEDSHETRISLSRAARNMAKQAEEAPLEQAGDVLQAAKVGALVHEWSAGSGNVLVNVNVQG